MHSNRIRHSYTRKHRHILLLLYSKLYLLDTNKRIIHIRNHEYGPQQPIYVFQSGHH